MSEFEVWFDKGVTDGLPVIPPTRERVERMLGGTGRDRAEVLGEMPPNYGRLTVEKAAINAVMAGCRPEYFPVIGAALTAIGDPNFELHGPATSTGGAALMLIVNGPVRRRLGIHGKANLFGPGFRANATIGRALRLTLINAGGALPGVYSKTSFGSPLRYSYICGENEEANPWTPFHVDRGFKREDSTVTAFKASNFCNISGGEGVGAEEILRQIATNMPPMYGGGDGVLLLLGVNHAQSLFEAGLTKRDVKQRLWELARLPISHFAEAFSSTERAHGRGDDKSVWRASSPDEIYIAVAGGAGPQNVYIGAGMPQTRVVRGL